MMRKSWRPAAAPLVIAVLLSPALAEEDGEERRWKDSAELGFVTTSGNAETSNIAFANKFNYDWEKAELVVDASAIRTETTDRTVENVGGELQVTEDEETTAEAYKVDGKYRHDIREALFWYVGTGWNRDRFAGISSRYYGGAGIGYRLFENDTHRLIGEVGADYTDESRTDDTDDSFAGARVFLGYERQLSETSKLSTDLELLQNLDDTDDLRANWVTSVTASVTSKVALKASYTLKWDNRPVVETIDDPAGIAPPVFFEFERVDTILSASLVVNF